MCQVFAAWLYSLMPAACHQPSRRWAQRTVRTHAQREREEAQSELFFLIDPELDFSKALVSLIQGIGGGATSHVGTIQFYMKYEPHPHGSEREGCPPAVVFVPLEFI